MAKKKASKAIAKDSVPKTGAIRVEKVFEHLTLTSVRLVNVTADLRILDGKVPNHAEISAVPNAGVSNDGTTVHGNVMLTVTGKPMGAVDGEDCSTVKIQAQYQCVYTPVDVAADQFMPHREAIANGIMFVVWPYLRELCYSLTGKMGIPPITMPLLALPHVTSEGFKEVARELAELREKTQKKKRPKRR
jgi:hypothetical protein